MKKKFRFRMSQNAHKRLITLNLRDNDSWSRKKAAYHIDCFEKQEKLKRVLTPQERQKIWK